MLDGLHVIYPNMGARCYRLASDKLREHVFDQKLLIAVAGLGRGGARGLSH